MARFHGQASTAARAIVEQIPAVRKQEFNRSWQGVGVHAKSIRRASGSRRGTGV